MATAPGFWRNLFIILLVWLFTFLFAGLIGEAYLRWHYFSLPLDDAHLPHPYLQNILNPAFPVKPGESLVRIGSFGLRKTGDSSDDRAEYKIIAIGDSCTFSVASSSQATSYPALLEKQIILATGKTTEVYNAGVPGYNSLQMLLYLNFLLKHIRPDEIMIYGGWNDVNVLRHDRGSRYIENNANGIPKMYRQRTYWELAAKKPDGLDKWLSASLLYDHLQFKIDAYFTKKNIVAYWHRNGLESTPNPPLILPEVIDNFRNNIESLIALAIGQGSEVAIVTLATPMQKRYSKEYAAQFMKQFGQDTGNFLRLTPAELYRYIEAFNSIIRQLAASYKIRLYDWDRWYRENPDLSLFDDVLHPNDRGYAYLVGRIIEERMR
ncbi:MAG: SGNH/GDSL hydrolase family protein [Gammaproteobacteria bacterium]